MKLTVKTLKGSHFQINVHPNDTVSNLRLSPPISAFYLMCILMNVIKMAFLVWN